VVFPPVFAGLPPVAGGEPPDPESGAVVPALFELQASRASEQPSVAAIEVKERNGMA
jgi:hypothetical protein